MTEQTTEWRECAFAGEDTSVYVGTPRRLHQAYRVCHLLERVGIPTEDHFGLGRRPEDCARCPVPALVEAVEAAVECGNKHIGLTAEACGCYIASCEAALAALPAEGERGEET